MIHSGDPKALTTKHLQGTSTCRNPQAGVLSSYGAVVELAQSRVKAWVENYSMTLNPRPYYTLNPETLLLARTSKKVNSNVVGR